MNSYPLIADHGLIGDLQTAALVTTDGEIDWFCVPRFDSPSVFASLLDSERGGKFRIAPAEPGYISKQLYVPDSAALITRFMTPGGMGEVIDFMPVPASQAPTEIHRLVRMARVVRGQMRFVFECAPRFDYGRADHTLDVTGAGAVFRAGDRQLTLHTAGPLTWDPADVTVPHPHGDAIRAAAVVSAGQVGAVMLETGAAGPPRRLGPPEVMSMFGDTVAFWRRWLGRSTYQGRWREQVSRSAMALKLMTYAPSGGSAPVRIGNGAADQLQLDIYGEALDSVYVAARGRVEIDHSGWTHLARILGWLCENWDQAEEGIWETRGGRQDFVYGRVNSWTAFDRAIRLAATGGRPGDLARWTAERDRIYQQVMEKGWSEKRGAFVQHYDTQVLDAALLRMVQVGLVVPSDPRWLSTLDAMDSELVSDSLVYRYNPEASPDGLRGSEGTFSLCTFWYVDALARSGRLDQAQLIFEKMFTYANHLGLYSEEIGLTGEQLGNFPQAFTHLALINAALTLNDRLDRHPV